MAGLFEGEGSFTANTYGPRRFIEMTLMMTDEDVVRRAAAILGARVYGPYGPYKNCKKACWQTRLGGARCAGWMMTLYVFMGARRQQAIREALDFWKTFRVTKQPRKKTP